MIPREGETMNYEPSAGESINETADQMVTLARTGGGTVTATFNDIELHATPTTDAASIVAFYTGECDRRRREYEASPKGQRHAAEAAAYRAKAAAAAAEGILPFAIKPEALADWEKTVKVNDDGYGACVVRYAARWAHLMDAAIAKGATITDIAKQSSHDADVEGITGFMYGAAVSILSQAWVHGEALRRWHNADYGVPDATGTVNPALLTIGSR